MTCRCTALVARLGHQVCITVISRAVSVFLPCCRHWLTVPLRRRFRLSDPSPVLGPLPLGLSRNRRREGWMMSPKAFLGRAGDSKDAATQMRLIDRWRDWLRDLSIRDKILVGYFLLGLPIIATLASDVLWRPSADGAARKPAHRNRARVAQPGKRAFRQPETDRGDRLLRTAQCGGARAGRSAQPVFPG